MAFRIKWINRGGPPRQPPDPNYPNGKDLDISQGAATTCIVSLPYPTGKGTIGAWYIECENCGFTTYVTTASRPDDPKSIKLACKRKLQ